MFRGHKDVVLCVIARAGEPLKESLFIRRPAQLVRRGAHESKVFQILGRSGNIGITDETQPKQRSVLLPTAYEYK